MFLSFSFLQDGSVTYTGYLLNMTSQQWLTAADCDRYIWWHMLVVIVPSNLDLTYSQNATMWVTGGSNTGGWPTPEDEDILTTAALSMGTGTISASFFQVPNEHILFYDDPKQQSRTEDAIIAYTWDHFLKDPSQPNWLVRFPMVKSVLRAMDTVTAFVEQSELKELEGYTPNFYTIAGASKRGWTTWLVGAVDTDRVVAIVPIVLDALNFIKFCHHQFKSYNGWSFALEDYYDEDIFSRLDSDNMQLLAEYEDPYYYLDRLTMPTLVINAVADEFQQPDDTHFWWSSLPEPKHFLIIPNAEHSLATGIAEAVPAIGTWIKYLLDYRPIPTMDWSIDNTTGTITVTLDNVPSDSTALHVRKYYANTWDGNLRRDFRIVNIDDPCETKLVSDGVCVNDKVLWRFEELTPESDGVTYIATHNTPTDGTYTAFFIDVTYMKDPLTNEAIYYPPGGGGWIPDFIPRDAPGQLEFTTEVSIVPNTFPFADCSGVGCNGTLV
jgi:PhoPQ-activated pathogenicity-related protein